RNQPPANDLRQRLGPLLDVLINRIRMHTRAHVASVVRTRLKEHHQTVRILDRKFAQNNLVHQSKDRGIGANPESERKDRDSGEQRAALKNTQGVTEISEYCCHKTLYTVEF